MTLESFFSLEAFMNSLYRSPLNIFLTVLISYCVYSLVFRHKVDYPTPRHKPVTLFRDYTPRELAKFNGESNTRVYLAIRRKVYDVTRGAKYYGPGGPYANFAGRDASRGLALNSFSPEVLTDLDSPLDDLKDLTPDQIQSLNDWESTFKDKYDIVGNLIDP
jgi:membrane-associated progesterone receptor component